MLTAARRAPNVCLMNSTLSNAKYALDRAVDAVTAYPLSNPALKAKHSVRHPGSEHFYPAGPLADIHYFHANAANRKTFDKHVAAVLRAEPSLSNNGAFHTLLLNARNAYTTVEIETGAEKARLAAKRQNVAAKAARRVALNLQEGVELRGVDVGQYNVILAGLEPVRQVVYERSVVAQENDVQRALVALQLVDMNTDSYNPYPRNGSETQYADYKAKNAILARYFRHGGTGGHFVTLLPNIKAVIEGFATKAALAYIQGYAVKLAQKAGEAIANDPELKGLSVTSARVNSNNLWRDSTATLVISNAYATLVFHTQMIWNVSCLGNSFNQWPTRRVS